MQKWKYLVIVRTRVWKSVEVGKLPLVAEDWLTLMPDGTSTTIDDFEKYILI